MDGKLKSIRYGDVIIELPYEIEYDKKVFKSDSFAQQATAMLWYAIKNVMEEIVKIKENKIAPLTEEDYLELHDRFGEDVEFVVRDMIDGKGERWTKNSLKKDKKY